MKKIDVTALGEILIDFTSVGNSETGQQLFECNAGGAPANVAAAIALLGGTSAFIGKVGQDQFGLFLESSLKSLGVTIDGLLKTSKDHTSLAFVSIGENGERSFSFCRNPGADTGLNANELNVDILENSIFLHIGSLSCTHEPSKTATIKAIEYVQNSGGLISYDPNWREPLWPSIEKGLETIKKLFFNANIVKISIEELALVFGISQIKNEEIPLYAQKLLDYGMQLVLVSLGPKGVYYRFGKTDGRVESWPIKVVDTTGAGDSFMGAFLYRLTKRMRKNITNLPVKQNGFYKEQLQNLLTDVQALEADLSFATATASLCVSKRGAIPALANRNEVENFMKDLQ